MDDIGALPPSEDRAGGLRPEPAEQSQPEALIPSAFAVACHLVKEVKGATTTSMTLSRCHGSKEEAIGRAMEYVKEVKPDFHVYEYIVAEIPLTTEIEEH